MDGAKLAKIVIEQAQEDGTVDVETPWAEHLGGNRYLLRNLPFYAYGVSFEDILRCEPKYEDDTRPYLIEVLEKSGNSTLRIILDESHNTSTRSQAILDQLQDMDCGWEGATSTFIVINVQPQCDFAAVCDYLTEQEVRWEHVDPTYEELYGSDA
ncbi:DUF4265 domain-containing protein [Woeseia oceani]|uniref:DUF4265 domain-containing protein n=1 Tax=Woeseia oceani TaxID=1548547 RepID=UPI0009F3F1F4|nr:DUF4265 domain-containing protein [Woeseia oceani]